MTELLATAPDLERIGDCIARYYCGESKTLIPTGPDTWKIVHTCDGGDVQGVQVIRKGGRFRFETCATTEPGAEGLPQLVIPGAERVSTGQLLARRMQEAKRAPKVAQREPGGLFSATVRDQLDLF